MNAVIFDMDGVLVDSERVVWESFRYAGEKTGVPDVERMAIIGLGLNDEAWIKRFRQEFGADSDRILEHEEAYLQNFYANGAAPAKKARSGCWSSCARGISRLQSRPRLRRLWCAAGWSGSGCCNILLRSFPATWSAARSRSRTFSSRRRVSWEAPLRCAP